MARQVKNEPETTKQEPIRYTYEKNVFDEETQAIKILDGEYRQIVFVYNKVKIQEKEDQIKVTFTYDVLSNPGGVETDCKAFRELLGIILENIMEKNISDRGDFLNESSRINRTGKPDTQRRIRKKGSSVSQQ